MSLKDIKDSAFLFTAIAFGKFIEYVQNTLETLYDGIIPPLLGYQQLQKIINKDYSSENIYLTEKYNKSGLLIWERESFGEYLKAGKKCMVLAAGGGREVLGLLREGVLVQAWECNKRLMDFGNKLLGEEHCNVQIKPMLAGKCPPIINGEVFDCCIVGWSAYCHILDKQERIMLLQDIKKAVKGPVLISFVGKKKVNTLRKVLRKGMSLITKNGKSISEDLVAKPGVIREGFDFAKISEEAKMAGFRVEKYREAPDVYPHAVLVHEER